MVLSHSAQPHLHQPQLFRRLSHISPFHPRHPFKLPFRPSWHRKITPWLKIQLKRLGTNIDDSRIPIQSDFCTCCLEPSRMTFKSNYQKSLSQDPPRYEALSYVWGSPTAEDPIFCHGEELLVTPNCKAAMQHLRHKKKRRVLWIDAICIDQGTTEERNHQVGLMGDVHSKAMRVVIWLGEATSQSDFTMSFLKDFHRILRRKWLAPFRGRLLDKKIKELKYIEKENSKTEFVTYQVLYSVFDSTWFERKWAIQEYVLSQDSYFQYGNKLLRTSELFTAIKELDHLIILRESSSGFVVPYSFGAYLDCFNEIRRSLTGKDIVREFSALEIFARGRSQEATNPKDEAFSLYGLLERMNIMVPPPDYSQSVEQIYTQAAKSVILHDDSLCLLLQTCESRDWPNLPSWVPDWNTSLSHGLLLTGSDFSLFAASKASTAKFAFLNGDQSISVRGCFVDNITRRAERYFPLLDDLIDFPELQPGPESKVPWEEVAIFEAYQGWMNIAGSLTTYPYGETAKQSFCNILMHRGFPNPLEKKLWLHRFDEWLQCYFQANSKHVVSSLVLNEPKAQLCADQDVEHIRPSESNIVERFPRERKLDYEASYESLASNNDAGFFDEASFLSCKRTRFFITSGGYMGKGLKAIQEGDLVALIAGVDMPIIIRKEGDLYRVKGPAYIHGIMKGEKWPEDEEDLIDIIFS